MKRRTFLGAIAAIPLVGYKCAVAKEGPKDLFIKINTKEGETTVFNKDISFKQRGNYVFVECYNSHHFILCVHSNSELIKNKHDFEKSIKKMFKNLPHFIFEITTDKGLINHFAVNNIRGYRYNTPIFEDDMAYVNKSVFGKVIEGFI